MQEQPIIIPGPAGNIEAMLHIPHDTATYKQVGIICHPHPLQGGTMSNKVVTTMQRTFRELGLPTVRFNFRGVGQSAGEYDHGKGETEDLFAVIAWAKQQFPTKTILLAGFSFGSYVAFRAAHSIENLEGLISIAPPVTYVDFNEIPLPTSTWIIVQGDEDEVIDPTAVFTWIDGLTIQPTVLHFENAGHFFHGRLVELRERLAAAIQQQVQLT